jgi:hypothetical protein
MHKKIFTVLIGLFLVASLTMAQGITDNSSEPLAYINYVEGKVLFRDFQKVELNMIIQEGDEINVTDGRVEILLKGGGIIRLDANTRVVFATLADQMIVLEIWSGNIYVKKGEMGIGIKTPDKSFNLSRQDFYLTEPTREFKGWNNEREKELRAAITEIGYPYPYGLNYYYSWRLRYFYPWPWRGYWWIPYHRHHYSPRTYRQYYPRRTVIHKNQLQAPRYSQNRQPIITRFSSTSRLSPSRLSPVRRFLTKSPTLYRPVQKNIRKK